MTTPTLYSLDAADSLRQIVAALFQGYNYRLYTEGQTRHDLLAAYRRLLAVRQRLPEEDAAPADWVTAVQSELAAGEADLALWLLGLTNKTAQNLGLRRDDRGRYLEEVDAHIRSLTDAAPGLQFEDAMLLLWAGAATLSVRGSRKSTAGKTLERAFMRAGLSLLGLAEGADFWLNMQRDAEVGREIDGEIASRRGRIRAEMGLIGVGNQEVIEDKINRVGPGGMVIFDQLGPKSSAWQTARQQQVEFIQIRNNRPLTQLHDFLKDRLDKPLTPPPADAEGLNAAVAALPAAVFAPGA